ncbi:hypothetical protein Y032_1018g3404 [Ancylostoma ceylanicum]|uniref:Uncharacterized protein n=1 Tax=Ancylostoma ceylanicum TaxID=53326 RepID=A0A016W8J7_9BILA|nr:hypothetical protein Y032_1018g3404 [Ancylostoma ceylanicum]
MRLSLSRLTNDVYTNGGSIVGGRGYKSSGRWQVGIRLLRLSSAVVVRGAPVVSSVSSLDRYRWAVSISNCETMLCYSSRGRVSYESICPPPILCWWSRRKR